MGWKRIALAGAAVLTLGTAGTIAFHLAPVRAALGLTPLGACPFGYGATTVATAPPVELPRTARPALGFVLERTTPDEIDRWSRDHGITCRATAHGSMRECSEVPATLTGAPVSATSMWFRFEHGTLAGIQTLRRTPTAEAAVTAFDHVTQALVAEVGAPTRRDGSVDRVRHGGALQQSMVAFEEPRYRAVLRVTNMGDGYVLTESYTR